MDKIKDIMIVRVVNPNYLLTFEPNEDITLAGVKGDDISNISF